MTERPPPGNDRPRATMLGRIRKLVLPDVPDFHGLLIEQCEVTAAGTRRLLDFLRDGTPEAASAVIALEHDGDLRKARSLETLHRAFATPMDREDFHDAIVSIDEVLNYAKTTVREFEALGLAPDQHMAAMAMHIHEGTSALLDGFSRLETDPEGADRAAERARKSERATEKVYRSALAELFDPDVQLQRLSVTIPDQSALGYATANVRLVTEILKHREIYRHLSNSADHVAHAGQVLADIVTKAT